MNIIKTGATVTDETGEVNLIMHGEIPNDCVVFFIKKADYEEAKKRLEA